MRTSYRTRLSSTDNDPAVSYRCVDYSCGNWFADMYHSFFKAGSLNLQPLEDDPHEPMIVDC